MHANRNSADMPVMEKMVAWYNPNQLLRTGLEVLVSTWIGRHSDARRIDAITYPAEVLDFSGADYRHEDDTFVFDYVADTGDGWDSTYSVAWLLSQPEWRDEDLSLPRGKLLVFGGDEVYPYPTRTSYETRLSRPYEIAGGPLADAQDNGVNPLGATVALPGNHDWYDSLVHFRKMFCSGRNACGRTTHQSHSYFVARLSHGWWIFAADTQLDNDLDEAQFDFLVKCARDVPTGERVVLCLAYPGWFEAWKGGNRHAPTAAARAIPEPDGERLEQFITELGERLHITVASDEHLYRRDASENGEQLIACGHGGAFLHPTHALPDDPQREFKHQCSFPDKETSRKLNIGNLKFLVNNPRFGSLAAIVYLMASWSNGLSAGRCYGAEQQVCIGEIGRMGIGQWAEAITAAFHSSLLNPVGAVVYALIFAGFVFFSDRPRTKLTLALGTLHAIAHIIAGVLIYWAANYLTVQGAGMIAKSIPQFLLSGAIIFVISWIVGSVIFGLYLYVSLNVFGLHTNEAFSALRHPDYKGFLRFRIKPDGQLDMWCIGIDKACCHWRISTVADGRVQVEPARPDLLKGRVVDHVAVAGGQGTELV